MMLPYDLFSRRLFGGDAKAISKQGVQTGAYSSDQPGESWLTSAVPMENLYCSCRLTSGAADTWAWDGMIK